MQTPASERRSGTHEQELDKLIPLPGHVHMRPGIKQVDNLIGSAPISV